jgi:hypothetical protein
MEAKEKAFNEQESLHLIQTMISTVKAEMEDDSFYYLIWGWLVFIASVAQYVLMKMDVNENYLGWAILMPAGGIASAVYGYRQEKKKRVKTYIDDLMKYVLITFMVSLFMVLFFQSKLQLNTYPMIMMVYGMWLFVSGAAIKFKPLIIGGIINWILCVVSFFFTFELQLLILAGAVLLGYIIPGHLLKNKFANSKM